MGGVWESSEPNSVWLLVVQASISGIHWSGTLQCQSSTFALLFFRRPYTSPIMISTTTGRTEKYVYRWIFWNIEQRCRVISIVVLTVVSGGMLTIRASCCPLAYSQSCAQSNFSALREANFPNYPPHSRCACTETCTCMTYIHNESTPCYLRTLPSTAVIIIKNFVLEER